MKYQINDIASPVNVTVIIVNFNTSHLLREMFTALETARGAISMQIIVVDNASTDNSLEELRAYPQAFVINSPENVGFGRANNLALPHVRGKHVLLLNTDAFVAPDALSTSLAYVDADRQAGIVGVRLIGRDGTLQPSCRFFPTPLNLFLQRTGLQRWMPWIRLVDDMAWDHLGARECDWVPGCYYLVRKEVIDRVGLFDPRYFLYYEEVDHCRRVKAAGWKVVYLGGTSCVHLGGESAATVSAVSAAGRQISALQVESEWLYLRKHHGLPGVALHLVLTGLGDLILAAKAILKGRGWRAIASVFANARHVYTIGARTRLGTLPTR